MHMWSRNFLPLLSTWIHLRLLVGLVLPEVKFGWCFIDHCLSVLIRYMASVYLLDFFKLFSQHQPLHITSVIALHAIMTYYILQIHMSCPSTRICFSQWWSIGLDMFGCNNVLYIFVVMICILFKSTRENCLIIMRLHMLPVTRSNVQKVYSKLHWMKSVIILYFINYYNKIVII